MLCTSSDCIVEDPAMDKSRYFSYISYQGKGLRSGFGGIGAGVVQIKSVGVAERTA